MSHTFYLSGSISDGGTLGPEDRALRIEGFHEAERLLRELGVEVLNPARHEAETGRTWVDYMRLSLVDIAEADYVATIPGWEKSRGAFIEVELARGIGIPVADVGDWLALLRESGETPADPDETAPLPAEQPAGAGEPQ